MLPAGSLVHVIDIERATTAPDAHGEPIPTWTAWKAGQRANIRPSSAREVEFAKSIQAVISHTVTIRYLAGLLHSDRIKWGSRYFAINGILPDEVHKDAMRILCTEAAESASLPIGAEGKNYANIEGAITDGHLVEFSGGDLIDSGVIASHVLLSDQLSIQLATPNSIVQRDISGAIYAVTLYGNLTGGTASLGGQPADQIPLQVFGSYQQTADVITYTRFLFGSPSFKVDAVGAVTAASFIGVGSGLTTINASNISSGTIANARTTGTSANVGDTLVLRDSEGFIAVGSLTALALTVSQQFAASASTSTTTPALIKGAVGMSVALLEFRDGNHNLLSSITENGFFSGNGSLLTALNAANLTGTIADARHSANIPLKDAANVFTLKQTAPEFKGAVNLPNEGGRTTYLLPNQFTDTYQGVTAYSLSGTGDITVNTGTTSIQSPTTTEPVTIRFPTSASANTYAGCNGADYYRTGRNHKMQCRVKLSHTTNMRVFVGLSSNTVTGHVNTDSPTGDFAGFRYSTTASETTWRVLTRNNTTTTNTATGVNIGSSTGFELEIEEDVTNSRWLFRIDGVLVATVILTLPRASLNLHFVVAIGTTENVAKNLDAGWVVIRSDL